MLTRREFMEFAAGLAGGAGAMGGLFDSIGRAFAIEPGAGSTVLDAEHVVILMQENRSFDHAYGSLKGVRGFNDPRAITLPDGNPVWVQADVDGKRFAPFRFDMKGSKATWMGSLPHSWTDQVDARNQGLHDKWIPSKKSGHRDYASMPLTMGHYTRADIPFYYALADAFTICDQYFCSSLTGTTPNRLYLWTGTIRAKASAAAYANVRNSEVDLEHLAQWPTFPERLEALGVSWKTYQNELTVDSGLSEVEDAWLANFGDNPLEYFQQYHPYLVPNRLRHVETRLNELPVEIAALKNRLANARLDAADRTSITKQLADRVAAFDWLQKEQNITRGRSLDKLTVLERALHEKGLCTNHGDPAYRQLENIVYRDKLLDRQFKAPKGDVLYQFRQDVERGQLPTVSWLVSPESFSDHPTSAWYGAWYIAEVLNILTSNPEVWKKTVFLLTYDENDGYFDHVPPFVAPHPEKPETGKASKGIDLALEHVELVQDRVRNGVAESRGGPIGLGYRVPMVVASPWSRGGCVCSQVFDHTSVLQFLEKLLSHKLGKPVREPNISQWRRTVCGDMTSSFHSEAELAGGGIAFPTRYAFLQSIHEVQYKPLPTGMDPLNPQEIEQLRKDRASSSRMPKQEPGTRPSAPLPYELLVNGRLNPEKKEFAIDFEVKKALFGERSAGSPFRVQAIGYMGKPQVRDYAVAAGDRLHDSWAIAVFSDGHYHLRVDGPNGFCREFRGDEADPLLQVVVASDRTTGNLNGVEIVVQNNGARREIDIRDNAYKNPPQTAVLESGARKVLSIDTQKSFGWYDFTIRSGKGSRFEQRFAGHAETGQWSTSDPAMG